EGLSNAVREVFVELYNQGLIYRGKYLINYCPSCGTALANDEVEHEEVAGALYHVKYQIEGKDEYIEIATTRPETILADVAIAVHPDDERYAHLTEQDVLILPIVGRKLRLVKDTYVDKEFGTGALKITPAHDPNDFAIAQRHNLEIINILNADGTFNENTPANYQGKNVKEARDLIIKELEEIGAFVGKDNIKHQVGHCYRCHNVVEPYYSDQWFVKMKPLAEKAYKAVNDGNTKIYPERWINTY
ncbi:class I tRNA ligase family protein, partial [Brachyspira pilosicoli]